MEIYDDDGNLVATGAEATAAWLAHVDKVQEHNRQALAQLRPHELARLDTWLRTRTHTAPPVRPQSRPSNGRAPREARNNRVRGSKRSSVRRSSERSGDSGSRTANLPPPASARGAGTRSTTSTRTPDFAGRSTASTHTRTRPAAARARSRARRRERHRQFRQALPLLASPRPRRPRGLCEVRSARGVLAVAWITEARDLTSRQLVARAPARRNPRLGDGKRRPPDEFVDESIIGAVAA